MVGFVAAVPIVVPAKQHVGVVVSAPALLTTDGGVARVVASVAALPRVERVSSAAAGLSVRRLWAAVHRHAHRGVPRDNVWRGADGVSACWTRGAVSAARLLRGQRWPEGSPPSDVRRSLRGEEVKQRLPNLHEAWARSAQVIALRVVSLRVARAIESTTVGPKAPVRWISCPVVTEGGSQLVFRSDCDLSAHVRYVTENKQVHPPAVHGLLHATSIRREAQRSPAPLNAGWVVAHVQRGRAAGARALRARSLSARQLMRRVVNVRLRQSAIVAVV
eukprot:1083057-Pyramimonas_sp.AAC.2